MLQIPVNRTKHKGQYETGLPRSSAEKQRAASVFLSVREIVL